MQSSEQIGAAPSRPPFAPRETAWLWVPYRWTTGVSMAFFGSALLALSLPGALSWSGHVVFSLLAVAFGLVGLFFVVTGFITATRHTPALTADERGITATCTGFDRSCIPWELVSGVTVVGRKSSDKAVAILTPNPEHWFAGADPIIVSTIRKMNHKHRLPGALYIMARSLRSKPEVVARDLADLLAIQQAEELKQPGGLVAEGEAASAT